MTDTNDPDDATGQDMKSDTYKGEYYTHMTKQVRLWLLKTRKRYAYLTLQMYHRHNGASAVKISWMSIRGGRYLIVDLVRIHLDVELHFGKYDPRISCYGG